MSAVSMYKRTEVVGRGKFGVVYKGYHKATKQVVAIKVLNLDTADDEVAEVQLEIQFLTELKNVPNVTHYYGSFLNDTKLWIIMDYCAGGSLRTLLKAGPFEDKYIAIILRELLAGLSAVHRLGFIHRDIKAANILITKDGAVQLCDFGVAAKITSTAFKRTTIAGTPYWMAPEVIREGDTYNSKADVWSLGITVYEIATGNPPYCDKDAMWAMQLISRHMPPRLEGREYHAALKEFVALCLDENPAERPTADDLSKSKLVKMYKNLPRSVLREVISNYLHWRDHNPSRDSVFVNIDDETVDKAAEQGAQSEHGAEGSHKLQVKWDFDSLSSREFAQEEQPATENVTYQDDGENFHTFQTLRGDGNDTVGTRGLYLNSRNTMSGMTHNTKTITPMKSATSDVPRLLQQMFAADDNLDKSDYAPPSHVLFSKAELGTGDRNESPTIEIPDIDSLASFNTILGSSPQLHAKLMPAGLYKSQSDMAHGISKAPLRKQTLVNQVAPAPSATALPHLAPSRSTPAGSSQVQLQINLPLGVPISPQIPMRQGSLSTSQSPSPNPAPSAPNTNSVTANSSPSRSMKALQSNLNPMLQPINHKACYDDNTFSNKKTPSQDVGTSNIAAYNGGGSNEGEDVVYSTDSNTVQSAAKQGRPRPGFYIQMPQPSAAFNNLSALTTDGSHGTQQDENVNQFGINPAHAAGLPMSMTPVSEKEHPFSDNKHTEKEVSTRKERSDTLLRPKLSSTPAAVAPSGITNAIAGKMAVGFPGPMPVNSAVNAAPVFPGIPPLKSEFFLDSTPKLRLISDLEVMISQFSLGLDTLESQLQ